jgi:hypothetical protein
MGNETKCVKCDSIHIIPSARVIDRDHDGTALNLRIGVARKPEALLFRGEETADVLARVCADCGHVELFIQGARSLYRAYLESIDGTA